MKAFATALDGVALIETQIFADDRGSFAETYNEAQLRTELSHVGIAESGPFVQDNQSLSQAGTIRGLHFQLPPHAQGKLVRVATGAAFDVAVDIRRTSATFGRWIGFELSGENHRQLWIPAGFAHGFLALRPDTLLLYKCTRSYHPLSEGSIVWNDTDIGIEWPLTSDLKPLLSPKDVKAPALRDAIIF